MTATKTKPAKPNAPTFPADPTEADIKAADRAQRLLDERAAQTGPDPDLRRKLLALRDG